MQTCASFMPTGMQIPQALGVCFGLNCPASYLLSTPLFICFCIRICGRGCRCRCLCTSMRVCLYTSTSVYLCLCIHITGDLVYGQIYVHVFWYQHEKRRAVTSLHGLSSQSRQVPRSRARERLAPGRAPPRGRISVGCRAGDSMGLYEVIGLSHENSLVPRQTYQGRGRLYWGSELLGRSLIGALLQRLKVESTPMNMTVLQPQSKERRTTGHQHESSSIHVPALLESAVPEPSGCLGDRGTKIRGGWEL